MDAKKKLIVGCTLVASVAVAAGALRHQEESDERGQVEFITNFYRNYLSQPYTNRTDRVPAGFFYSKAADALIDENRRLCEKLSRGDEICGYGADSDSFLDAQEIDPALTFDKARFRATVSGRNLVDVSFNVYPELGSYYDRTFRYVFVKEGGGWRVDDVLYGDGGRFAADRSMRHEVSEENAAVRARARDFFEVLSWVSIYVSQEHMLDRAERFVTDPVSICSDAGSCELVRKGKDGGRLRETVEALHRAYRTDDPNGIRELKEYLPKPVKIIKGSPVNVDALELTFQDNAWWISKIDLRKLGHTISR